MRLCVGGGHRWGRSKHAWTIGTGCAVRLVIAHVMPGAAVPTIERVLGAHVMPGAAVPTIELVLGLVFLCVTAAAMIGGHGPSLLE